MDSKSFVTVIVSAAILAGTGCGTEEGSPATQPKVGGEMSVPATLPIAEVSGFESPVESADQFFAAPDVLVVATVTEVRDRYATTDAPEQETSGQEEIVGIVLDVDEVLVGTVAAGEPIVRWPGYRLDRGQARVSQIEYNGVAFNAQSKGKKYLIPLAAAVEPGEYQLFHSGLVAQVVGENEKLRPLGDSESLSSLGFRDLNDVRVAADAYR